MIKAIGCDIVAINRMKKILETCPAILKRVYSINEINEYQKRNQSIHYLAARFAAKEAIVKALKEYNYDLNTIEILNNKLGEPYVIINNKEMPNILISISYEKEYTIAYTLLLSI